MSILNLNIHNLCSAKVRDHFSVTIKNKWYKCIGSQYSVVGLVIGYGLDNEGVRV
jgi:hypothetical protein